MAVHPLYTGFAKRFGASISETTLRANPLCTSRLAIRGPATSSWRATCGVPETAVRGGMRKEVRRNPLCAEHWQWRRRRRQSENFLVQKILVDSTPLHARAPHRMREISHVTRHKWSPHAARGSQYHFSSPHSRYMAHPYRDRTWQCRMAVIRVMAPSCHAPNRSQLGTV
jgi:hypothetical protein